MKRKCTVNCQKFLEANFEVIKNPLYKRVIYTEEYGLNFAANDVCRDAFDV